MCLCFEGGVTFKIPRNCKGKPVVNLDWDTPLRKVLVEETLWYTNLRTRESRSSKERWTPVAAQLRVLAFVRYDGGAIEHRVSQL